MIARVWLGLVALIVAACSAASGPGPTIPAAQPTTIIVYVTPSAAEPTTIIVYVTQSPSPATPSATSSPTHAPTLVPSAPTATAPIATASPSATPQTGPDLGELKDTIRQDIEDALEYFIDRVQKVTVSADSIYVEYGDSNWVKSILKQHQWTAIEAIADEIYGYGDYWANMRPKVTLKGNSALGGGSLTSVTSADQLQAIYDIDMSETDWYQQAKFTVSGKLY
ncbi:MAG: hypothetical protein M3P18_11660 [Actinomycetota bacterium]|nr:hypothetical protein [Actinomycetota bacterium]